MNEHHIVTKYIHKIRLDLKREDVKHLIMIINFGVIAWRYIDDSGVNILKLILCSKSKLVRSLHSVMYLYQSLEVK